MLGFTAVGVTHEFLKNAQYIYFYAAFIIYVMFYNGKAINAAKAGGNVLIE